MKSLTLPLLVCLLIPVQTFAQVKTKFPAFKTEQLESSLNVGYAVRLVDVDHDGKRDIVVVDTTRVVWYQNPTWKKRIIIEGQTKPDNVCIAPYDIDGDGKLDFALGAEWRNLNTKGGGTLQWLKRGKTLEEKWSVHPIGSEPTIHRIRFADIDGDNKKELIVVPLLGRGSSRKKNWMDGKPVRVLAFHIPKNPQTDRWPMDVLNQSLHVTHNFWPVPVDQGKRSNLLITAYEGVFVLNKTKNGEWETVKIGTGNQDNPKGRLGASEIKLGKMKNKRDVFVTTIEPWHGNQVVVYTPPAKPKNRPVLWNREVIDDELQWGHAVSCADLDGDGNEEIVIGVRDESKEKGSPTRGIRIYKRTDKGWVRNIIDNGGIACEDMAVADMNNDGRPDIVAVGRQTRNMRIYWNMGMK